MRRALVGCLALSLGATPVGVFLMLRRMSLTGDAMAHAILPGAAIGFLFAGLSLQAMTLGGVVAGMAVALAAGFVSRSTVLREDASLAAFYLISLALGVLIVSTRGSNIDLMHLLFGTVLALNNDAIVLIAGIASLSLLVLATLYRPLVLECLEPAFLRSVSSLSPLTHHAFLTLVVINLVGGFHALGTLMSIGVMILPAAAARFWARDISTLIGIAVGLALLGSYAGLLLSFHADLPTGSCIVLSIGALYVVSLLIGREGVLTNWYRSTRHLEA
ncbi:MAG: metal ABC transporter permease [Gammaproteobacteria bacterium]|nr:metal ABC transporter permease [Gammaproteobacteria bacterium]